MAVHRAPVYVMPIYGVRQDEHADVTDWAEVDVHLHLVRDESLVKEIVEPGVRIIWLILYLFG